MWTGKKFNCNKKAYYKLRDLSDEICKEYGLSVVEKTGGKTPRSIYFAEKNGEPTKFNLMREAIDFAIAHSNCKEVFEYAMRHQGYRVELNYNRKYWTIRSENSKKAVRMYRLGEDYTNEAIMRRIKELGSKQWDIAMRYMSDTKRMQHFQPRKVYFKDSFRKVKKRTGLYALYLHYLYRLGKLPKNKSRKPMSPEMREAWRELDKISRQVTLVSKQNLNNLTQVNEFVLLTERKIKDVTALRNKIYNKLRRCKDEQRDELLQRRDDCTAVLKQLRKDKKVAISIIEDNPKIKENIRIEVQAQNLARGKKSTYRKKEYIR